MSGYFPSPPVYNPTNRVPFTTKTTLSNFRELASHQKVCSLWNKEIGSMHDSFQMTWNPLRGGCSLLSACCLQLDSGVCTIVVVSLVCVTSRWIFFSCKTVIDTVKIMQVILYNRMCVDDINVTNSNFTDNEVKVLGSFHTASRWCYTSVVFPNVYLRQITRADATDECHPSYIGSKVKKIYTRQYMFFNCMPLYEKAQSARLKGRHLFIPPNFLLASVGW